MKERPILMNGEMIKAILKGRKTQTRRVLRTQPIKFAECPKVFADGIWRFHYDAPNKHKSPCGKIGDRLWVRETWASVAIGLEAARCQHEDFMSESPIYYRASGNGVHENTGLKWKPSIHMPRWACRILLEVTDVRVERVQEITEEDAKAEGMVTGGMAQGYYFTAKEYFHGLWDSINDKKSGWFVYEDENTGEKKKQWVEYNFCWDSNPYVWVVTFKRVEV